MVYFQRCEVCPHTHTLTISPGSVQRFTERLISQVPISPSSSPSSPLLLWKATFRARERVRGAPERGRVGEGGRKAGRPRKTAKELYRIEGGSRYAQCRCPSLRFFWIKCATVGSRFKILCPLSTAAINKKKIEFPLEAYGPGGPPWGVNCIIYLIVDRPGTIQKDCG